MAKSTMKKWLGRIGKTFVILALMGGAAYATAKFYNRSIPLKSTQIDARRHVEDYAVSPVTFRNIDVFFNTEPVAAAPSAPLAAAIAPLDINIELGGTKMNLQQALTYTDTNGLLVMHNGKIIYETYKNGADFDSQFISWSMAKSITSILFGIALEAGDIASIDDDVSKYLPQFKQSVFDGVTLKNLLMQRAGTSYREFKLFGTAEVDVLAEQSIFKGEKRFIDLGNIELTREAAAGEVFNYSTLTSAILGQVIESATGKTLAAYTQEKLWQPAGMQSPAYWMLDGKLDAGGHAFAGGGFNATMRDYARIGQMMLQGGMMNGKQILSAEWVAESTQYTGSEPVIAGTPRGYGYQWWTFLNTEIFEAVGIHGQFISVDPKTNTVIVKMSYWPARGGGSLAKDNHALLSAIRAELVK